MTPHEFVFDFDYYPSRNNSVSLNGLVTANMAVAVESSDPSLDYKVLEFGVSLNNSVYGRQPFGLTENREVDLSLSARDRGSYNTIYGFVDGQFVTGLTYSYMIYSGYHDSFEIVTVPTFQKTVSSMVVFYPFDFHNYSTGSSNYVGVRVVLEETHSGQQKVLERAMRVLDFINMSRLRVVVRD